MSSAAAATDTQNYLGLIFQYNVEAYKMFQKLAEGLPNPITAAAFKHFAEDERNHRDLLEIRYLSSGEARVPVTLGGDLRFQDALEGDLSHRELTEFLIVRERTMERKLSDALKSASPGQRNLLHYISAGKRAHVVILERELEMLKIYPDWYEREDAESLIVHGESE